MGRVGRGGRIPDIAGRIPDERPDTGQTIVRVRGVAMGTVGAMAPVMPTYSIVTDLNTGTTLAVGKDGRTYTMDEIDAAERRAKGGDPAARALLVNVDHGVDERGRRLSQAQVKARLAQMIHDCPECQAARAHAEQPPPWRPTDPLRREPEGWVEPARPASSHARRRQRERMRRPPFGGPGPIGGGLPN